MTSTDRELELRELEDSARRNSILLYDNEIVENVTRIAEEVKELCQCDLEHLPSIETFILHYPSSTHLPAEEFLKIKGIILVDEDHVIMPPDDQIGNDNLTSTIVRRSSVMNKMNIQATTRTTENGIPELTKIPEKMATTKNFI